jgi:hypothetical protein
MKERKTECTHNRDWSSEGLPRSVDMDATQMDGWMIILVQLWLCDDVDGLHVKIDNLNNLLVGFCFIRSIDNIVLKTIQKVYGN